MYRFIKNTFLKRDDQKEILKGAGVSVLFKGCGLVTAYLFAFMVARQLGAEAWGEFSLALSILTLGAIIGVVGFDQFMLKLASSITEQGYLQALYKRALVVVIIISVAAGGIIFLLSEPIAAIVFKNPGLQVSFKISAFAVLPFALINLNAGMLQGFRRVKEFSFIRFVSHHLGGVMLFAGLILFWRDYQVVITAYTLSLYLICAVTFFWIRKRFRLVPSAAGKVSDEGNWSAKNLTWKAFPFMMVALLFFLKTWADTVMVGMFMTEQDVGIYNIALKLAGLLLLSLTAVSVVAAPQFSEYYSTGNMMELKTSVRYISKIIFFSTLPLFILLVIFAESVLSLFGQEFTDGSTPLKILAVGFFINAWFGATGYLLQMTGNQVVLQYITLVSVVTGIILNLFLIPQLGIFGAALATAISLFVWNGLGAYWVVKKIKVVPLFWVN